MGGSASVAQFCCGVVSIETNESQRRGATSPSHNIEKISLSKSTLREPIIHVSASRQANLLTCVPITPRGNDMINAFPYYCPLCMEYFKDVLRTQCCGNYVCFPCCSTFIQSKGIEVSSIIDVLSRSEDVSATCRCPHCGTDAFAPVLVELSDTNIRDYSDSHFQTAAREGFSAASSGHSGGLASMSQSGAHGPPRGESPVKVGDSYEALKRKMIPLQPAAGTLTGHAELVAASTSADTAVSEEAASADMVLAIPRRLNAEAGGSECECVGQGGGESGDQSHDRRGSSSTREGFVPVRVTVPVPEGEREEGEVSTAAGWEGSGGAYSHSSAKSDAHADAGADIDACFCSHHCRSNSNSSDGSGEGFTSRTASSSSPLTIRRSGPSGGSAGVDLQCESSSGSATGSGGGGGSGGNCPAARVGLMSQAPDGSQRGGNLIGDDEDEDDDDEVCALQTQLAFGDDDVHADMGADAFEVSSSGVEVVLQRRPERGSLLREKEKAVLERGGSTRGGHGHGAAEQGIASVLHKALYLGQ